MPPRVTRKTQQEDNQGRQHSHTPLPCCAGLASTMRAAPGRLTASAVGPGSTHRLLHKFLHILPRSCFVHNRVISPNRGLSRTYQSSLPYIMLDIASVYAFHIYLYVFPTHTHAFLMHLYTFVYVCVPLVCVFFDQFSA